VDWQKCYWFNNGIQVVYNAKCVIIMSQLGIAGHIFFPYHFNKFKFFFLSELVYFWHFGVPQLLLHKTYNEENKGIRRSKGGVNLNFCHNYSLIHTKFVFAGGGKLGYCHCSKQG
jgi:hypothetical protein